MSITEVSVCNSALIKVGADRISSLTQDTKSAIVCNTLFHNVRDDVLRAHPWNFAIKRTELNQSADVPIFEYDFIYELPSDCLRVLNLQRDDMDWVVEGKQILTNEDEVQIRYIYRNDDPASWDSIFAETFAWRLACELSYNLTQSSALFAQCAAAYKAKLSEARSIDGAEGIIKGLVADEWLNVRR